MSGEQQFTFLSVCIQQIQSSILSLSSHSGWRWWCGWRHLGVYSVIILLWSGWCCRLMISRGRNINSHGDSVWELVADNMAQDQQQAFDVWTEDASLIVVFVGQHQQLEYKTEPTPLYFTALVVILVCLDRLKLSDGHIVVMNMYCKCSFVSKKHFKLHSWSCLWLQTAPSASSILCCSKFMFPITIGWRNSSKFLFCFQPSLLLMLWSGSFSSLSFPEEPFFQMGTGRTGRLEVFLCINWAVSAWLAVLLYIRTVYMQLTMRKLVNKKSSCKYFPVAEKIF